jgi:hypothetical protein
MQRIIVAHLDHFSKHLLYHTANNKQKQLASYRMVRANHLFGQVNFLKKDTEQTKQYTEGEEQVKEYKNE